MTTAEAAGGLAARIGAPAAGDAGVPAPVPDGPRPDGPRLVPPAAPPAPSSAAPADAARAAADPAPAKPAPRPLLGPRSRPVVLGAASLAAALLIWFLVARLVGPRKLPDPAAVFDEIARLLRTPLSGRTLWGHTLFSLRRVLAAYALAVATGLPLGLLMGWNATIRKIAMPVFEIFRPIPPIAWIPIAILWLGVAEGSKIYICYVGAFIILALNAFTGIRYVDPLLLSAARVLGAGRRRLFLGVAVPAALPSIFAGLQNAMSMAWMCVLAAELVGGREGVGFIIIQGMNLDRPDMIMAGMVVIGALGAVLALLLRVLEKLACPWRKELV